MNHAKIGHMQVNINMKNAAFYRDLFTFLGWKTLCDEEVAPGVKLLGMEDENHASVWFADPQKKVDNDYDGVGMNHLGISVASQADVDAMVAYLKEHSVAALFETPRHRPEFCDGPANTYYQVMFESPDKLLFEVVYTGPRQG